jgi:hypothetical protein
MSYPQSNRKADRFRSAPRQGKIKPVAASRDVPGEMSSAFGRGNVVAKIVRFPPADLEKADRFRSAPRKAKNQAGCSSEGSAKKTLCTLRSDFRGIETPGTYNCRLKKRTGLGPHPTLEKPQLWPLFRGMSGVLKLEARLRMLQHAQRVSGNISQTCRFFGASRALFYIWKKRYE